MGTKRIGIALSDDAGTIAFPHSVLEVSAQVTAQIETLLAKEGVTAVIIGDSMNRHNTQNAVARHAEKLGNDLQAAGFSVSFEWEGYSSAHARRLHTYSEGTPRGTVSRTRSKTRSPQHVDASAAALILQSYLDARH